MPIPKVTVQICTYNRENFIKQAIDSVLSQSFTDFEIIITDDCSTDNTEKVVNSYTDKRIKYIKNETNLGIAKNRNKSLKMSNGEYIAVLDSDDYWIDKDKLKKQVEFLDLYKDYVLIGTYMNIVDKNNVLIKKTKYINKYFFNYNFILKKLLLIKNFFCHSSVMYRKKEVYNIGSYDENLPISWEDYDLWLKLGLKYKIANLNRVSVNYRIHESQSDANKKEIVKKTDYFILDKYKKLYPFYFLAKLRYKIREILNK